MRYNLILFMLTVILSHNAGARHAEPATNTYKLTIHKIELCTNAPLSSNTDTTCTNAHVVGNTPTTVDIASQNIGETLANFGTPMQLPANTTFSHARVTISREIKMASITRHSNQTYATSTPISSDLGKYATYGIGARTSYETSDEAEEQNLPPLPAKHNFYLLNPGVTAKYCTNSDCSATATETTNTVAQSLAYSDHPALAMTNLTDAHDEVQLIFALTTPYTTTATATSSLNIQIGTQKAYWWNNINDSMCYINIIPPSMVISMS